MKKTEVKWKANYEALKAYVAETGHFPAKHTALNNWIRYQRKKIKAGVMEESKQRLFLDLSAQRTFAHTGGRKRKKSVEAVEGSLF